MQQIGPGAQPTRFAKLRASFWLSAVWSVLVPTVFFVTMEWIHRGTLGGDFWSARVQPHPWGFIFEWLFLVLLYVFISQLSGLHWLATLLTGIISNVPGTVTYFKLEMRGEPFLPWDITQVGDFAGVAGKVELDIQPTMLWTLAIFLVLLAASCFLRMPYRKETRWRWRIGSAAVSGFLWCLLVFGVYLNASMCEFFGIYSDMWMQDRYYKNYGVITGFMTNLQVLDIEAPENYSEKSVLELAARVEETAETAKPLYKESYAATADAPEQRPNIIFVMNESFWDASRLEGISYDRELTPNLTALKNEAAYGYCYTPSFGGGTCDVEFEALTGFSVEHLPAGSKPY